MKVDAIIIFIVYLHVTELFCAPLDNVDNEQPKIKLAAGASLATDLSHGLSPKERENALVGLR